MSIDHREWWKEGERPEKPFIIIGKVIVAGLVIATLVLALG